MKIIFEIPGGGIGKDDAVAFGEEIETKYSVKAKCNTWQLAGSALHINGMTVEGEDAKVNAFVGTYLGHVSWLRIKQAKLQDMA